MPVSTARKDDAENKEKTMLYRTKILASAALALCLSSAVSAETPTAETVVATVNGEDITLGHMIAIRATLPEQYQNLPNDVLFRGILDQLVQQTALKQAHNGPLPKRVAIALENEERSLLAAEAIEAVAQKPLADGELQAAYDARFKSGETSKEWDASHILVETEEEAKALIQELGGGVEFAALARRESTGPSGPRGGALGWFGPGMMVPEFQTAVEGMEVGGISEPIKTQFGWHVIRLNDERAKDAPTFDDVKEELENEIRSKAVETYLQQATNKATIDRMTASEIDVSVLSDTTLLED